MGENAFAGVQKGKGMFQAHRTARARSAFGQLGQQANIPEVCNFVLRCFYLCAQETTVPRLLSFCSLRISSSCIRQMHRV